MANISIIIPALNEEANLRNNLKLLKDHQSGLEMEIIVSIASTNTDNSAKVAREYGCRTVMAQSCGRAHQLNEGAAIAKGDVLFFLHADAIPPNHFDQYILEYIDKGYEAGCFSYRFDSDHPLLKVNAYFTKSINFSTGGGDQGLFIKKGVFEKLGNYDEKHVIMEDFELVRRLLQQDVKFGIIDKPMLISARKYQKNSYLRVNLVNLVAMILFRKNASPAKIKALCKSYLR